MGADSKIEWTDASWNPVTGCTKVSAGCAHCYAERMAKRLAGRCGYRAGDPFSVTAHPEKLDAPLHWKKPRMIFVCSMGDLFHGDVPFDFIDQVFAVTALACWHTFQVLTKRPERMAEWFASVDRIGSAHFRTHHEADRMCSLGKDWNRLPLFIGPGLRGNPENNYLVPRLAQKHMTIGHEGLSWPLPNVWLGTSCENQEAADERIPHLLRCPAAVRFLSLEPLLGPLPNIDLSGIGWVIVGGESGPGARPMDLSWARLIRDQCAAAGVPYFFKQVNKKQPIPDDLMIRQWPKG